MNILQSAWQKMRTESFGVRAEFRVTATAAAAHFGPNNNILELADNLVQAGCVLRVETATACDFRLLRLEVLREAARKSKEREETWGELSGNNDYYYYYLVGKSVISSATIFSTLPNLLMIDQKTIGISGICNATISRRC